MDRPVRIADGTPRLLVSIIITNYNYGRFLGDAIESALRQTYDDVEVIVVDDGSTDNSREVIERYCDRVVPVFQANRGQFSASNAGFARTHGDIVIFLDPDDMLLPHVAQEVVREFQTNPRLAKVQYRLEVIDVMGHPTRYCVPPCQLAMPRGDLRRHMLLFPDDVRTPSTSGNAFAASVLRQIMPMPSAPDYKTGADLYLDNVAPLFGPVQSLAAIGGYYRRHDQNTYDSTSLNLVRIRAMIKRTAFNRTYIRENACRLGLSNVPGHNEDILSVTYVASRIASCRLDPASHPITDDSRPRLARLCVMASYRRFDLTARTRVLFMVWCIAATFFPKRLSQWLLTLTFFPERRGLLGRLVR